MKTSSSLFVLLAASAALLHAADPVVTNVVAAQRAGTKLVDITFNVSDADSNSVAMSVQVSDNNGTTFTIPATALSGDINVAATPTPAAKALVWDAAVDFNQQFKSTMVVRVIANDGTPPGPPPAGMVLIPAGPFVMGKAGSAWSARTVTVSAFYMEKFEVTKDLWKRVKTYADANGYVFSGNPVTTFAGGHPVVLNWFDPVKWCNARSQMEGLTPVYYTDASFTTVYKTGQPFLYTIDPIKAKWSANGYRLPTEAEWEKAARGMLVGMDYPWGNTINPGDANVQDSSPFAVFGTGTTTPVGYYNGDQTPAGPDRANGYGLYDMCGNVMEWTWDWVENYYPDDQTVDPRGWDYVSGYKTIRGGSAAIGIPPQVWARTFLLNPAAVRAGFRCARGL